AMLLSTHDLDLALRSSDRIWLLPKHGPLSVGAPEDLVLSGAFEAAFAGEGVQFEPALGSFRVRSAAQGNISVEGSGLARAWTIRALERAGYHVVEDNVRMRVVVRDGSPPGSGRPAWSLIEPDRSLECRSVEELLDRLRS
ncbi:MAG: ABC transporter ATP-binding protein, partial [Vicinamibacteraceae bacterium]